MRVNLNKTKMMVSGLEEKVRASKIDPHGVRKESESQRSLLYKLREVGSRKVYVHPCKGSPLAWPRILFAHHVQL